jgi:hypothetical protein
MIERAGPVLLFAAALLPLASGASQSGDGNMAGNMAGNSLAGAPAPLRESAPGEGVICALAITIAVAEIGRRCFPGQDAAVQAELARTEARIEDYVLRNAPANRAALDRFRRDQLGSGVGTPFCEGDAAGMYRAIAGEGVARIRAGADRLLARQGRPTWGDCL